MKIGYARVSTLEQNTDMQKKALKKAGCEKVLIDKVSGTVAKRPGLEKAKELLRKGAGKNNLLFYRAQFYVRFGRSDRAEPQV